ncbi:sialate O-acetylesterase [Mucilaginibacter terrae]|uniref:Sialate O-acetylesterase domain-containing protein n=1 Tax=Mucilaginibacter terrae TaxID=1955052 RepID=A0ABU3GP35_9SPHI|nr:sialate O-acetylesterase [Mucilaginibacter terrae]MDT3401549.1 hypothetical protein [Mucilaginibacter terrae]
MKINKGLCVWLLTLTCIFNRAQIFAQERTTIQNNGSEVKRNVNPRFEIYLLMGQSNMAGRGPITPEMKNEANDSVLVLTKQGDWVVAHHPLHYDKPGVAAAGPGLAFGIKMAEANPAIKIGLVPCAVGGTSIEKWLPGAYDEATKTHPYDDAVERIKTAMNYGIVKGVIWHQGEANSGAAKVNQYPEQLKELIARLRKLVGNSELPFIAGELGEFHPNHTIFNEQLNKLPQEAPFTAVVSAYGLTQKGDMLHFDGASADELGRRYADKMLEVQKTLIK